jgi:phosphoribosylformylglycinamidine synthase subunit PurS
MRFKCEVDISPRKDILDPQGDAVVKALANLGFSGIAEVKVGKYLTIALEAESAEAAQSTLDEMCRKLLANPITEDYTARVKEREG